MTLTAVRRHQAGSLTAGTTYPFSPIADFTPNTLALLMLAYDNSAAAGADPFVSVVDSVGNVWIDRGATINNGGSVANAGICLRFLTATIARLATTDVVTVTFNTVTTAKSVILLELGSDVAGRAPAVWSVVNGGSGGNTVNPSFTVGPINVGDMLIPTLAYADNPSATGDSDTLNGTWTAADSGITASPTGDLNARSISQRKLQTTAASTQTWNLTMARTGAYAFRYAIVRESGWMRTWTGAAWVQKPLKVWSGSAWVPKPVKRWTGTAWVPV